MTDNIKAKVFISCGQRDKEEKQLAHAIAERMHEAGFSTYIAVEEQSLIGIRENVFPQLESSEYVVFIDFKRELLKIGRKSLGHRGSLMSHQELAIASFLDKEAAMFQEEGMKGLDGLLGLVQGNIISFSDRENLPRIVMDAISQRGWNPAWRNTLTLGRDCTIHEDATTREDGMRCRFFQIVVRNNHRNRLAINCHAYLESANNVISGNAIPIEMIEHKWQGYVLPAAQIPSQMTRRFDAFYVRHAAPKQLRFNMFTDSTSMVPPLEGDGPFDLTYVVLSENFRAARMACRLTKADTVDGIRLEPHDRNAS